jgi:hypothetical protein
MLGVTWNHSLQPTTQLTPLLTYPPAATHLFSPLSCSNHRGLRHYWGLRVKGQHTKTTGRRGKTVGVAKKR